MNIESFKTADTRKSVVGGKGAALVKLTKAGFVVPPGFVIPAGIDVKKETEVVLKAFDDLSSAYVAVRSSAANEDGSEAAWAGQLHTALNVTRDNLIDAIADCQLSGDSDRARSYAAQRGIESGGVAVVVQQMVQSDISGVAFSVHPITQDKTKAVIEAGLGLGEAVVSGEITPDTYVVDKNTGEVTEKHIAVQTKKLVMEAGKNDYVLIQNGDEQKLSFAQLKRVTDLVKELEKLQKEPIDVEWAFAADILYVLQCRPITALG